MTNTRYHFKTNHTRNDYDTTCSNEAHWKSRKRLISEEFLNSEILIVNTF